MGGPKAERQTRIGNDDVHVGKIFWEPGDEGLSSLTLARVMRHDMTQAANFFLERLGTFGASTGSDDLGARACEASASGGPEARGRAGDQHGQLFRIDHLGIICR